MGKECNDKVIDVAFEALNEYYEQIDEDEQSIDVESPRSNLLGGSLPAINIFHAT